MVIQQIFQDGPVNMTGQTNQQNTHGKARDGFNNVIVAANPSYQQAPEAEFWRDVARQAHERGWHFVQLAMRKIPEQPNASTICIPARLWHLATLSHNLNTRKKFSLPWLDAGFMHLMEDWEHRRWQLDEHNPDVLDNMRGLGHWIDIALSALRPAAVLTCNKIDHAPALFHRAGRYYGAFTAMIERSPFDDIWFEPDGLFGESHIWSEYPGCADSREQLFHRRLGSRILNQLNQNPYGFRIGEGGAEGSTRSLFAGLKSPVFFMPMDNVLWTGWEQPNHPQLEREYYHPSPEAAMAQVQEAVAALGGTLVVKNHPSCVYIDESKMPPGAIFHDGDLRQMIEQCDVVVSFNTKVAFPAVAMGKPVVTLSPNPIAAGGCTYHSAGPEGVAPALEAAANHVGLDEKLDRFVPFAGWLASRYFYSHSNQPEIPQRTPRDLVNQIVDAAEGCREMPGAEVKHVISRLGELVGKKPLPLHDTPGEMFSEHVEDLISHPHFLEKMAPIIENWTVSDVARPLRQPPEEKPEASAQLEEIHRVMNGGDCESAVNLGLELLKSQPNCVETLLTVSQALASQERVGEAEAALRQGLMIDPDRPGLARWAADFYIHAAEPELALPWLTKLFEIDPELAMQGEYDDFESMIGLLEALKQESRSEDIPPVLDVLHRLSQDDPQRQYRMQGIMAQHVVDLDIMNKRLRQRAVMLTHENRQCKAKGAQSQALERTVAAQKKQIAELQNQLATNQKALHKYQDPGEFFRRELNTFDARWYWAIRSSIYGSGFWPRTHHLMGLCFMILGRRNSNRALNVIFGAARSQRLREKYEALKKRK